MNSYLVYENNITLQSPNPQNVYSCSDMAIERPTRIMSSTPKTPICTNPTTLMVPVS